MKYATVAARLGVWKAAVVAGVLATSLALASSAGAAVIVVPNSGNAQTNGANLGAAITTANTNGAPSNTIVIGNTTYAPTAALPAVTGNLTITADHSIQILTAGGPILSGVSIPSSDTTLLTINAGASLTLQGLDFRSTGAVGGANPGLADNGTLVAYNVSFNANAAPSTILVNSGGTANLTESSVLDNLGIGVDVEGGTLNTDNVTIRGNVGGIQNLGTSNLTNTLLSNNASTNSSTNCLAAVTANTTDHIVDSDGTCVAPGDTVSKAGTTTTPLATGTSPTAANGGPVSTVKISSTSPAVGFGDSAFCSLTDGRFFVRPSGATGACDVGSYQHDGVQDTTPASCTVTNVIAGPPKQQQVTVQDTISGLGPEFGSISDAAGAAPGNNQADAVDGLTITNGTVSAGPFSSSGPSTTGVVLTATKTNQAMLTSWSFTLTNWAGVSTLCK